MGSADRIVRIALAIVLAALGFFALTGVLQIVAFVLAVVFLATSAIGFCPLYAPFKFSTLKKA
mgnify:CR=1 FL=1